MNNVNKLFMLAGKACFTVDNGKNTHYTYKVIKSKGNNSVYFVMVLTGPDNTAHYSYLGLLDKDTGAIRQTHKSKINENAQSFKVARWIMSILWGSNKTPDGYSILHAGKCCRCGRKLTDPESLILGIGPECRKLVKI